MEETRIDIPLGDRIKLQERKYQTYIDEKENVIIRLDGDSFSKFTKGFRKPFDDILKNTMIRTTESLIERFSAVTGYTQSDEITLIIPASNQLVLGGKVLKLASLSAGFASTKFNLFLKEEIENSDCSDELKHTLILSKVGFAWFDSRVFAFEDKNEVFNALLWRQRDAEKNSISVLGYSVFSNKELLHKNGLEKKELLLSKGIVWEDLEPAYKYGTIIKKVTFELKAGVIRTKFERYSDKLNFSEENVNFIFEKCVK